MALKKYRFVGLDRDVWLPDWITVEIKIIDHPRFRSYQHFTGQNKTTWHDTGNPDTRADGEYGWAAAGRPGGEVGGYNFIFDDTKIIQAAPLNEVTWAAGTPDGNTYSWHAEQAWGGGVNFQKSLEVGAALHGGLIAAKGWNVDTSLVKHQYWYGKWCPGQILNRNLWSSVVRMVTDAAVAARAAADGTVPAPKPAVTYPAPIAIPELDRFKGGAVEELPAFIDFTFGGKKYRAFPAFDRVRTVEAQKRLRRPDGSEKEVVGDWIKVGEEFDLDYHVIRLDDAARYHPMGRTPWGTWVWLKNVVRVSDVQAA